MDTSEKRKAKLKQRLSKIANKDKNPCPKCGSIDILPQTPIKVDEEIDISNPRQMLGAWARAHKNNGGELQGPCYFICRECGHKGPAVDCSGMTSQEVGQDKETYAEMKRLWNSQEPPPQGGLGGKMDNELDVIGGAIGVLWIVVAAIILSVHTYYDIDKVIGNKDRPEYSMKRAGEFADQFLTKLGIEE